MPAVVRRDLHVIATDEAEENICEALLSIAVPDGALRGADAPAVHVARGPARQG